MAQQSGLTANTVAERQSKAGSRRAPCPQRVDFDQRQVCQSLLQCKMIAQAKHDAGHLARAKPCSFISDPVNRPLLQPFDQGLEAGGSIGKLAHFAARVGIGCPCLGPGLRRGDVWCVHPKRLP